MRTRGFVFAAAIALAALSAPVAAQQEGKRPLTRAEQVFINSTAQSVPDMRILSAGESEISMRLRTGLFPGVSARLKAEQHCAKYGKTYDPDTIRRSDPGKGEVTETYTCVSAGQTDPLREQRQAAERGDPEAQTELGLNYQLGKGVPKDIPQAAKWFRLAAGQGYARAQNYLGILYSDGTGLGRDYRKAAELFRLAARQDHEAAQLSLGVAYELGLGVPVDYPRALMWYRFSDYKGGEKLRTRLERKMTRTQLDASEELTLECLRYNFFNCM